MQAAHEMTTHANKFITRPRIVRMKAELLLARMHTLLEGGKLLPKLMPTSYLMAPAMLLLIISMMLITMTPVIITPMQ